MNIFFAAHYLKQGYRITRACWDVECLSSSDFDDGVTLDIDDLLANDWKVVLDGIVDDFAGVKYEEAK